MHHPKKCHQTSYFVQVDIMTFHLWVNCSFNIQYANRIHVIMWTTLLPCSRAATWNAVEQNVSHLFSPDVVFPRFWCRTRSRSHIPQIYLRCNNFSCSLTLEDVWPVDLPSTMWPHPPPAVYLCVKWFVLFLAPDHRIEPPLFAEEGGIFHRGRKLATTANLDGGGLRERAKEREGTMRERET